MGEWSKTIGEVGEAIVSRLIARLGWSPAQENVTIPCVNGENHKSGTAPRLTHGIDALFNYPCPLIQGTLQNLVVSSKYSDSEYPDAPSGKFKGHLRDIAETLECFRRSIVRRQMQQNAPALKKTDDAGVIFWLNNAQADDDRSVLPLLEGVQIPKEWSFDTVYVVDNHQAAFLWDALGCVDERFRGSAVKFYYPDTGKNGDPLLKRTDGDILPVQMVSSPILSLRVADLASGATTLVLCINEPFSSAVFQRVYALALALSSGWAKSIELGFSSFDVINHENEVQAAKMLFSERRVADSVKVFTYRGDFRSTSQ